MKESEKYKIFHDRGHRKGYIKGYQHGYLQCQKDLALKLDSVLKGIKSNADKEIERICFACAKNI